MKFDIAEKVRVIADGEVGEVLSFHVDADGTTYRITSVEVDLAAKQLLNGVKTCKESELEAAPSEVEPKDEAKGEVSE